MNIQTLSLPEYEKFLADSHMSYSFLQSPAFVKSHENYETIKIYAGMEEGKILYAIIVFFRPAMRFFHYACSPREWVAASPELARDEKQIASFSNALAAAVKKDGALAYLMESGVEYQQHDKSGDVLENGFHHEDYRNMLAQAGFTKSRLWRGYDERRQSRWVSWIDLQKDLDTQTRGYPFSLDAPYTLYSWQELLKQMAGNTRRSFQKADLPYLEYSITRGDEEFDLSEFDALLEMSAEKHSFQAGDSAKRKETLACFGAHGYLCTSYLNLDAYDTFLRNKEEELSAKEAKAAEVCEKMPESKKKRNQLLEIQEQKSHNEKEIEQLAKLKEDEQDTLIPLASGIFLETPSEMIYLHGGSRPDLARYMGPYVNQKAMIHLALDHHLRRYNFWGISGRFMPEEEGYGVFYFKKNLGATVGEYCGEFVRPLHPLLGSSFLKKIRKNDLEN